MKKMYFLCLILLIFSCREIDYNLEPVQYENSKILEEHNFGIKTEGNNPDDNIIFSSCNTFVYDYLVIRDNREYVAKHVNNAEYNMFENFEYMPKALTTDSVYMKNFIYYQKRNEKQTLSPNQSVIKVQWTNSDSTILTTWSEGIIENHKNLWMHPLRFYHMWPTFTAPWPYVKFPIQVGDTYSWDKKLDGGWGSDRYIQWKEAVQFNYEYNVVDIAVLKIKDNVIKCFKISATGTSEIGNTKVNFYFNPRLGFVKFEYELMDDSQLIMSMVDFELDCDQNLDWSF